METAEGASEVVCYDLGGDLGVLLRVSPSPAASPAPPAFPRPLIVLDRSPSMGSLTRWACSRAVPEALQRLGYSSGCAVPVITFDSTSERVRAKDARRDLKLGELHDFIIEPRGRSTIMAPAVALVRAAVKEVPASNVIVISDGFVKDMPALVGEMSKAADVAGRRVNFALLRFFNGKPPDTAALAALASMGTTGTAPCEDCSPGHWQCKACFNLNVRKSASCKCGAARPPGGEKPADAHAIFTECVSRAFAESVTPHARLTADQPISRLPLSESCCLVGSSKVQEVPCGSATVLVLPKAPSAVDIDGRTVRVRVQPLGGLDELTGFCDASLSQLRLWLVGGVRKSDLHTVVAWFRRLQSRHDDRAAGATTGVLGRAWMARRSIEQRESSIGRLCALADAETLVAKELNSKQQGEFLRGASVARAHSLLARRALGSDITFHDACRRAVSERDPVAAPQAEAARSESENPFASVRGGGSYSDYVQAASVLSPCAADMTVTAILEVVGGVGAPVTMAVSDRPDDVWSMEVRAVDSGCYLSEADIWSAKAMGEDLRFGGMCANAVVPLERCGRTAHEVYERNLGPVGFLHIGAQVRGEPPRGPWGWESAPFSPHVARGAREAATLRCLLGVRHDDRQLARRDAELAVDLAMQILSRKRFLEDDRRVREAVDALLGGDGLSGLDSSLAAFTAVLVHSSDAVPPQVARLLYCSMFTAGGCCDGAIRAGASVRVPAVVRLLSRNPDVSCEVTEEQVLQRVRAAFDPDAERSAGRLDASELDVVLADEAEIRGRLLALDWLPPIEQVSSLCRIVRAVASESRDAAVDHMLTPQRWSDAVFKTNDGSGDDGVFFVAVAAAGALYTGGTPQATAAAAAVADAAEAKQQLKILLQRAVVDAHEQSLCKVVAERMEARRKQAVACRPAESQCFDDFVSRCRERARIVRVAPAPHLSFCVCGHAGSGKSTLAGFIAINGGSVDAREVDRASKHARELGKSSFAISHLMDATKAERERGTTIVGSKREFWPNSGGYHGTVLDVPAGGYVTNTMRGIARADVGLLLVPLQMWEAALHPVSRMGYGGSMLHSQLLQLSGVKQLAVFVSQIDAGDCSEERFAVIATEVRKTLLRTGWSSDMADCVPIIPLSVVGELNTGYGDSAVQTRLHLPWWDGIAVRTLSCLRSRPAALSRADVESECTL
eukprot:TRINITY_DN2027_c0_g2_i1.p1 TRINITY_DN2027_c0_g2~~TRINITY_DN2027_c0_g2_i1.p1  ORF type:complete len:1275 (+),score=348.69 TRINITY_DN2027_c0_g2_i1:267-3827(+)